MKYAAYRQGYEYEVNHWDGTGKCPFKIRDDWSLPMADDETLTRIKESLAVEQDIPIDLNGKYEVVDGCTRLTLLRELGKGVDYVVLEHLDNEIDSHMYAILKQLERRNVSTTSRKKLAAEIARLLTQRKHAENVESGISEDPRCSNIPISQSREIVSDVAKQVNLSEKAVKKGIKESNEADRILESLPTQVKAHVKRKDAKITSKEMAKIDANRDQIMQVERALRVGQAEDIRQAWQLVYGKTIGQMSNGKARSKSTKAPPKPPKKLDKKAYLTQWDNAIGPLVRVLANIAKGLSELNGENHKRVEEHLHKATSEMDKWLGVKR